MAEGAEVDIVYYGAKGVEGQLKWLAHNAFPVIENSEGLTKDSSIATEKVSPTGPRRLISIIDMLCVLVSRFQVAFAAATEYITL